MDLRTSGTVGVIRRRTLLSACALASTSCVLPKRTALVASASAAEAIASSIERPRIPSRVFSLSDFAPQTAGPLGALRAAIDAAASRGGGRVVVPAGDWLMDGPIHLRSRIDLHLAEGAHVRFTGTPEAYLPPVFTRWEGTEVFNRSPFLYGRDLEDVAITGAGTLDGQGEANFFPWRALQKEDQSRLRRLGAEGAPLEARVFGAAARLRPQFVNLVGCRRVLIDGPRLVDSPFWVAHLVYCRDVVVRNLSIVSRHLNSDGVDIDSCEDVLIERCRFDVGDDGIALKSGRDADGWRVGKPTRRVVIRDCVYEGAAGGGMAIGSELSGGIEDIHVDGYRMNRVSHGVYFKSNLDRGGAVRRVRIRGVRALEAESVIVFNNDYHGYRGGDAPTLFDDIEVADVACGKALVGLSIVGNPKAPIRNLSIRDVDIPQAQTPLRIRDVENLAFDAVRINGRLQEPVRETAPETFDVKLKN